MVDGKKLKKIVIQIFKKRGMSLSHATISANALINAEYVGAYGHGVSMLKMYFERIIKKFIIIIITFLKIFIIISIKKILSIKN